MKRTTKQNTAIRQVIDEAGRPLSPQEVLVAAQVHVPEMGIATVYRNLKHLLEAGDIQAVSLPGDSMRYESAVACAHHHHHFQCTVCLRVFDVHGCPRGLADMVPPGFSIEHHDITLYGRCADPACQAA